MNSAFYDIFGIFGFLFIIFSSIWILYKNKNPSKWIIIILLIIGFIGLAVDIISVYTNFFI